MMNSVRSGSRRLRIIRSLVVMGRLNSDTDPMLRDLRLLQLLIWRLIRGCSIVLRLPVLNSGLETWEDWERTLLSMLK